MMRVDTYLSGTFLVTITTVTSVVGLLLVRRRFAALGLTTYQEVGGYMLSVVGTIYAVILGLVVVRSMGRFQEARQSTEQEASGLAEIVLLTQHVPLEKRAPIRELVRHYANLVIDVEWPSMGWGRHAPAARATALALIDEVFRFEPHTESEKAI